MAGLADSAATDAARPTGSPARAASGPGAARPVRAAPAAQPGRGRGPGRGAAGAGRPARRRARPAELLAHGQQRQLEIATALAGRPRVLLLDEPSSGMSAHERAGLGDLLRRIVKTATVVMAEHDVHLVRTVATRVTAFSEGKKIAEGDADEVFDATEVRRVFLRGRRDA